MIRLRCVAVRDETHDVRTWSFEAEGGPVAFQPGQALTLLLPAGPRTFTIASSARRPERIEVTVKRAGSATRWMHDALVPGATLDARGPHGRFVLPGPDAGGLALVSAGSGATPLMAMLRALAHDGAATSLAWVHAARSPADVLFGTELAALQAAMPGLAVSVVVGRADPGWFGYRGRLGRRLLGVMVPDLAARTVLCCGPAPFMDAVRRAHAAEGGTADRFLVEHFAPPAASAAPAAEPGPQEGWTVRLGARAFRALPTETVLAAAIRSGVVIPCGCGGGMCGTCRLRLREGAVAMAHAGGLSAAEEADGLVLACSARPRSDLVLEG